MRYSAAGESVLSAESTAKAWQLRDRVSDRERFFIDFTYDRQVTGNLEKAYHTLESWLQTYPRAEQPNALSLLGGIASQGTGRFDRVIETAQRAIADDPDFHVGYGNLARAYFYLDRFPEAESTLQRASERKLEQSSLLALRYNIALLKGDQDQMARISGSGQRQAESGTSVGARRGSRSGGFRPPASRPAVIEPGPGARPARGRPRGGRGLPGRTSSVGSRLREWYRREKERDGGARAVEGAGCPIRRRPCPGPRGRLIQITGARRRSGKALPGRYLREVYLRARASRVGRTGAGQTRRQRGAAADRPSLRAGGEWS